MKNKLAKILKIIGIVLLSIGGFLFLAGLSDIERSDGAPTLCVAISLCIIGLSCLITCEILNLLQEIVNNTEQEMADSVRQNNTLRLIAEKMGVDFSSSDAADAEKEAQKKQIEIKKKKSWF